MSTKGYRLQLVRNKRPVVAALTAAAGIIRSISIKKYTPLVRRREFTLLEHNPGALVSRCSIFREKGTGKSPTIVLGGFVPDATETVEFQRKLLVQHGSIYFVNYSRHGFCQEMFTAQLTDLIEDLANKGQKPVIMAVSFGCGLLAGFLRQAKEWVHQSIRGVILVSPVMTTDDLIRPSDQKRDGVRILESNLTKIVSADPANEKDISRHVLRGLTTAPVW